MQSGQTAPEIIAPPRPKAPTPAPSPRQAFPSEFSLSLCGRLLTFG